MIQILNSGSTKRTIYIDTCVISGFVKHDMRPEDDEAFERLTHKVRDNSLIVCASTVAREEIDGIPAPYRKAHLLRYEALQIVRGSTTTWLDEDPSSTSFGSLVQHPDYSRLRGILRHENDARHLFQAKMAGVIDVVTVDYKSVLKEASQLDREVGIRVYSPQQYLSQWST